MHTPVNLNMAECSGQVGATREKIRELSWAAGMAGAYVMILGMDIVSTPVEQLQDCGRMVWFFNDTNLSVMSPHDELKYGDTRYVLGLPGSFYIVYGLSVSNMGIKGMTAGTYNLKWFDCVTGSQVLQNNVNVTTGDVQWVRPRGIGVECVLYVVNAGAVGTGITVISPNGGEEWTGDSQKTISWNSAGTVGNVNIYISTNAGTSWTYLVTNTANDGSQIITVPNTPSAACRIRVQEPDGHPTDISDANFTIATQATNAFTSAYTGEDQEMVYKKKKVINKIIEKGYTTNP